MGWIERVKLPLVDQGTLSSWDFQGNWFQDGWWELVEAWKEEGP